MCCLMGWYALRVMEDVAVEGDLRQASIVVRRLTYRHEYWDGRKSVVAAREFPLMPGYLLVGQPTIPVNTTRRWHDFLRDAGTGRPMSVRDADEIISRCEAGEFDVRHTSPGHFEEGARVLVKMLGLLGVVLRRAKKWVYDVLLDTGVSVQVGQGGLETA